MPNLSDMIDEVLINLAGYTFQQDRATYITTDVSADNSTIASPIILQLASTDNIAKGTIEIDEDKYSQNLKSLINYYTQIHMYLGDSITVLPSIIPVLLFNYRWFYMVW
jgi:hypothetical protein